MGVVTVYKSIAYVLYCLIKESTHLHESRTYDSLKDPVIYMECLKIRISFKFNGLVVEVTY
jgi:hypothetical protein